MSKALPFCLAYTFPFLVFLCGQGGWMMFAVPIFTFAFVPVLDILSGTDPFNPSPSNEKELRDHLCFRLITFFWVPVELLLTAYGMWWVLQPGRSSWEIAGMIVAVGMTNGVIGITFAHELMHKSNKFEQFLAEVLMITVSYPHFCVEHVLGHHKKVGTLADSATARFGENFYSFYSRVIPSSIRSAWHIEVHRSAVLGLPIWKNRLIKYALTLVSVYALIWAVFGWHALCFFVLQGIVAFTSLEITNYIEHYGLVRKEISPGVYEKTLPKHSWNSGHRVSNWFLINLARHSDHHFIASKRYQVLTNYKDTAPQLPFGYGTMFVIALIPPLWFKLMNPRVIDWRQGKVGLNYNKPDKALHLILMPENLLAMWHKWGNAAKVSILSIADTRNHDGPFARR